MGMMVHSLTDVLISGLSLGTGAPNVCDWLWGSLMHPGRSVLTGRTGCCRGARMSGRLRCQLLSDVNLAVQVEHLRGG